MPPNSSNYDDFILPIPFPLPLPYLISSYAIVAISVGTLGNALVLLSMVQTRHMKTTTNFLVAHLAVSDLGSCLFSFPTLIPVLFGDDFLVENVVLCKFRFYSASICGSQSALTLNLIAFNRYFLVTKKSRTYHRIFNRRSTTALIMLLWAFTAVMILLPEMGVGNVVPVESVGLCLVEPGDFESWLYWSLLICLSFFFCFMAIPLFYILTFLSARQSRRRVVSQACPASNIPMSIHPANPPAHPTTHPLTSQNAGVVAVSHAGRSAERCRQSCKRDARRFTTISALVYLTFTFSWSPLCLVHLFNWRFAIPAWLYHLCFILVYNNSCINPFIYAGTNRHFRKRIKQLLKLD